jgi:hypothetical protein
VPDSIPLVSLRRGLRGTGNCRACVRSGSELLEPEVCVTAADLARCYTARAVLCEGIEPAAFHGIDDPGHRLCTASSALPWQRQRKLRRPDEVELHHSKVREKLARAYPDTTKESKSL